MFNFFLKIKKHMNVCKKKKEGGRRMCPVSLKVALGKLRNYSNHRCMGGLHSLFTAISVVNAEKYTDYNWQIISFSKNSC